MRTKGQMIETMAEGFKECDLDCAQWNMETLRELAGIVVAALEKDHYYIYDNRKPDENS
jgi:hypothetical protein